MPHQVKGFNHEIALKAEKEYNKLKDGKLSTQLRAIMAFEHNSAEHIADVFQVSTRSVFRWIHKFSNHGIEGLKDHPKGHYKSKLSDTQKQQIKDWIKKGTNSKNDIIHWTLEKLKTEIYSEFSVEITTTALWKNLKKMGLTLKKPRPIHHKSNKEEQEAFKKNL